jgi:hypothetical protein
MSKEPDSYRTYLQKTVDEDKARLMGERPPRLLPQALGMDGSEIHFNLPTWWDTAFGTTKLAYATWLASQAAPEKPE